ncbi:(2E,6E)-farnesyl diphosphate synthase [Erwinia sp. BNK-24-b]|uniref:(2E,6E)-farnesyl diphosphate synthase n=1 Tax=Erwinia TaxID=551 RepID=UPI001FEEAD46|nr:(2E,6E)-farnesyl diphosphate synthase [Erwinia phyllosphaerae]MBV4366034.1 (2E,6E)-farnesyl diphosphate synthase [Erwinia phyllosphaerae]
MDFSALLNAHHARVNQALQRFISNLPFQKSPLVNAIEYGALLGGKRLRPFLVYATGNMLHADDSALDAPAAAVECIHAYSLIHDDLPAMDDDNLRRGQPTCHIKFGEDTAILAGDALQTLAFTILADTPMAGVTAENRIAMLSELAQASGVAGMCGGQALDLAAEGRQVNLNELEQIHRYKTGALIRSAVRLGALTAGERGRSALPLLDRYAEAIGLAFQVQDDILDVVGDTAIIGKRQGADQQLGKSTYPALMGLESAREKAWALCQESFSALEILAAQGFDTTSLQALASYIIERNK